MATVDMTHRKLNFPPRFIPYLEKHRIFEFLHECVELLVQVRPRDHIQFLKKILSCAARKKDKQRIVFIAPPNFDREKFAEMLAECLGIQSISKLHMELLTKEKILKDHFKDLGAEEMSEGTSFICPGEGEEIYHTYYQPGEEPSFSFRGESLIDEEKGATMEGEENIEELEEEEKPCVCVCPCVENEQFEKGFLQEKADQIKEDNKKLESQKRSEKNEESEKHRLSGQFEKLEIHEESNIEDKKEEKEYQTKPLCSTEQKSTRKLLTSKDDSLMDIKMVEIDYRILAECETAAKGWILIDFPKTRQEAEKLSKMGIIPTHAIRIIINEEDEMNDRHYKWNVIEWMKVYKYVPVMEIKMRGRTMEEFSKDMCRLLSVMPHRHAPMLPRIVLIGSRGSGATTQAQKLSKKYGLVHVEFELVIARMLQQDDDMAKLYKQQMATRVEPEVEAVILEKALLAKACINRGWVLTGYPTNIDQLRMLDITATPPNRVIFLEVPARECFVRLYYRKFDPCLGDEYKLPQIEPFGADSYVTSGISPEVAERLLSHPRNNKKQIIHDIETYYLQKKKMMDYCGKTASYIDGNRTVDAVFELIEQVIINPSPAEPPRDPLIINYGIDESYERLKKFRLAPGMFLNNLLLNPPGKRS